MKSLRMLYIAVVLLSAATLFWTAKVGAGEPNAQFVTVRIVRVVRAVHARTKVGVCQKTTGSAVEQHSL